MSKVYLLTVGAENLVVSDSEMALRILHCQMVDEKQGTDGMKYQPANKGGVLMKVIEDSQIVE